MAEIRVETKIKATVREVFDYVADVETHPLYADFVTVVKITSAIRNGKGVTFYQVHQGSDEKIASEILEFIPAKHIYWITHEKGGDVFVKYWFEETDGFTKVLHTIDSTQFDDPVVNKHVYDNNARELANLKKIMEKA